MDDLDRLLDSGSLLGMVRLLEIRSRQLVRTQVAGLYTSAFRGTGLDFTGFRPYEAGDDVRHIDWNVTARTRCTHVKCFQEERERVVMVGVDVSASMRFGSGWRSKLEVAREVAAVLALVAIMGNDRAGLILMGAGTSRIVRPGKGRNHGLRLLRYLLQPAGATEFTAVSWQAAVQRLPRRSVVFLISDFLPTPTRRELAALAHRHDLVPVWVFDPLERRLPDAGAVPAVDPESGAAGWLPLGSGRRLRQINARLDEHASAVRALFRSLRLDHVEIAADRNFIDPLRRLMARRLSRQER